MNDCQINTMLTFSAFCCFLKGGTAAFAHKTTRQGIKSAGYREMKMADDKVAANNKGEAGIKFKYQ